jgi:hypothetical protein
MTRDNKNKIGRAPQLKLIILKNKTGVFFVLKLVIEKGALRT